VPSAWLPTAPAQSSRIFGELEGDGYRPPTSNSNPSNRFTRPEI